MSEPLLLEGRGLKKTYGGVIAVSDAAVTLRAGEILGLVGPNGAGKTTLVDLVSGAQPADSGSLTLRGKRLTGPPSKRAKAGLGRTFQYPQLALDLTVLENILVGRFARRLSSPLAMILAAGRGLFALASKDDIAAVEAVAEEVRIGGLDRLCGSLTLGEQRLVEVARALAQDPDVMLLDEPFAGSDARGVEGITEAIHVVQRRGNGVILVDHNVDVVASLVHRIMLMDYGRVVFDGDPRECLRSAEMQLVYFGVRDDEDGT